MRIRRILCPTDFARTGKTALELASSIARDTGACEISWAEDPSDSHWIAHYLQIVSQNTIHSAFATKGMNRLRIENLNENRRIAMIVFITLP